ncbi:glycerophosphodiester phosphodiesterase [Bacillus thermotolerans]|uniref:Glycerophosphoryl diester phosphodiesterase n=1 Tax=Bacillus thermotolerans TaxID=1221996 RepID=A0A0F5ICR6_BACTR|nr:glycerophosphodiester phosphodiesterase [Bacillus thermotolerans]KKB42972.1 Glycerophosphoryl diester phosphodiesterase [Bacillus thermotolerans]KKB43880.1 Glycerophosphoryl diester phosphodiesterase [Bacillus thermotolerans]
MTAIFAHRGFSAAAPENTMSAFKAAERVGADGIELDVQLTKDGRLVVIHDEKLERTTNGRGFVKDWEWKDLARLQANRKFPNVTVDIGLPLLEDVFEWMTGNALICNVELKNNEFDYEGIEEKVLALIRQFNYEERVIISSFNHYSLTRMRQIAPDIETAVLYSSHLYMPWKYAEAIRAQAIHPNIRTVKDGIIEETLNAGLSIRPYTVNKTKQMKRFMEKGCSAIFTDDPQTALAIRQGLRNQ